MSKAKHQFFTITLSLPQSSQTLHTPSSQGDTNSTKQQWRAVCNKWGMNIIRELVYVQDSILEESYTDDGRNNENGRIDDNRQNDPSSKVNDLNSSIIMVDGCQAYKVKDRLIVADLIDQTGNVIIGPVDADANTEEATNELTHSSIAKSAGIQPGDEIHAVYGMKNPKLGLLFGIMRDSITFQ